MESRFVEISNQRQLIAAKMKEGLLDYFNECLKHNHGPICNIAPWHNFSFLCNARKTVAKLEST